MVNNQNKGVQKMKITGDNIVEYTKTLSELKDEKLPIRISVAIAYNLTMLEPIYNIISNSLISLANEYGKRDENGNIVRNGDNVILQEDKIQEANEKVKVLNSEEFELKALKKIKMDDLYQVQALSPRDIMALTFMIEEE